MTFYPIREFGKGGVIADQPPWELPENAFSDAINVDFRDNAARKSLGYLRRVGAVQPNPVWMQTFDDGTAKQLAYASQDRLWLLSGATWNNVGGPYTSTDNWHSFPFGSFCVFNNGQDAPQTRAPGGNFIALAGWPAGWQAGILRPYKSFMVAARMVNDGGGAKANTIYWSDTAPANELPPNWSPGAPSLAGFLPLPANAGDVVDMEEMGDSLLIYTQSEVYALTFTGSAARPMTLRKLPISNGIASRECVKRFANRHICLGLNRIFVHDTVNQIYVADEIVEEKFFAQVADLNQVRVVVNERWSEVIIYYPTQASLGIQCNRALVWNWEDNTWTFRDLPNVVCVSYAFLPTEGVKWSDWSATRWIDLTQRWSELGGSNENLGLFYLSQSDQALHQADLGFTADGTYIVSRLERTDIDLDTLLKKPTDRQKMVRSLYPQISGQGVVDFYIGFSNASGGDVRWKGPISLNLDERPRRYKVDAVGHGRYLGWRLEQRNGGFYQFSGMEIDLEESYAR